VVIGYNPNRCQAAAAARARVAVVRHYGALWRPFVRGACGGCAAPHRRRRKPRRPAASRARAAPAGPARRPPSARGRASTHTRVPSGARRLRTSIVAGGPRYHGSPYSIAQPSVQYHERVYLYLFWCWSLTYTLLEYSCTTGNFTSITLKRGRTTRGACGRAAHHLAERGLRGDADALAAAREQQPLHDEVGLPGALPGRHRRRERREIRVVVGVPRLPCAWPYR
jgi:hypothetical protein